MNKEEMLMEQYKQIRECLKQIVNTDDLVDVRFYKSELRNKIDYLCMLKERIIKNERS